MLRNVIKTLRFKEGEQIIDPYRGVNTTGNLQTFMAHGSLTLNFRQSNRLRQTH